MKIASQLKQLVIGLSLEMSWGTRSLRERRASYFVDVLMYRLLKVIPRSRLLNRVRHLQLRDGPTLWYRWNRGDLASIREVFVLEGYRLPVGFVPRTVLDLGANIGLTSIWLANNFPLEHLIAVEPVPENARLARRNFQFNAVPGELIEAAVGPTAGHVSFLTEDSSNLGRVGTGGPLQVEMVSIHDALARFVGDIDLLKLDIEGGEGAILTDIDARWLRRFSVIIGEFHPEVVDEAHLRFIVADQGFIEYDWHTVDGGRNHAMTFVRGSSR